MADKVRVGLVGPGGWAEYFHAQIVAAHDGAVLAAVCGRNRERAEALAVEHSVDRVYTDVQEMIDKMAHTMYDAPGIGLAAIQVGWDKSVLIYDLAPRNESRSLQVLINPKIITKEGEIISENEGCLSVPDFRADVKRAAHLTVEGHDRDGNPSRIDAEGMLAIVMQHPLGQQRSAAADNARYPPFQ